jgi:putative oxidoreductase
MITNKKLDLTLLLSRVILGTVVLAHGVQKLLGWFGGYGFDGTMGFFTNTIGLPYIFGLLIILAESVGMLALILGLFGRFISGSLVLIMAGAIATIHGQYGFFMNWGGNQGGEGYEFHLLIIALSLVTVILGSGAYSLDQLLFSKKESPKQTTFA